MSININFDPIKIWILVYMYIYIYINRKYDSFGYHHILITTECRVL